MADDEERRPLLDGDDDRPDRSQDRSLKSVLLGSASLTQLEKLLCAIVLATTCLAAVGFGLFAGEAYRLGEELKKHEGHGGEGRVTSTLSRPTSSVSATRTSAPGPTPTWSPPNNNDEICLTPECVHMASNLLDSIDFSASPCSDFYQFSTGGWRHEHPIPPSRGFFGIAQWIDERNERVLHEILSESSAGMQVDDRRNVRTLKDYFDSCADEDVLDRVGAAPLLDLVNRTLSLWRSSASSAIKRKERLTSVLAFLHARSVPSLFENSLEGDVVQDPTKMRIWIQQSGLGLPALDYYKDEEALGVYEEVVGKALVSLYDVLDDKAMSAQGKKVAKDLVAFETAISKISVPEEDLEDPATTYHLVSISSLEASYFPLLNWRDYYASFSPRPELPGIVVVKSLDYLSSLYSLLSSTPDSTLESYFLWHLVQSFSPLLGSSQPTRKAVSRLEAYLSGLDEGVKPDRSATCLKSLLEDLGLLAGRYFVQRTFGGESKTYAEDIIKAIITAFKERLEELDWIDDKVRKLAKEKADAIKVKIGFPTSPNTSDPLALARYYSPNAINKSDYFGNVLRSRVADVRRMFNKVGAKRDLGEWDMIPSEVNAYYNPSSNDINFPSGFLQSPYFSKDWPEYLAFGAFGSAAGHELTHAFDKDGRAYDKDGRLRDWWTNGTTERFDELTHCFLEQYGNYSMEDPKGRKVHLNSKFTLGEDMADAGGVAQAFRAWRDRYEEDPEGKKYRNFRLPGLNLTRQQTFWLAYGRGWARSLKASEAIKRIYTDPHSATRYRVIGPLSNDPNFLESWGCKKGDPMDRPNKCRIW